MSCDSKKSLSESKAIDVALTASMISSLLGIGLESFFGGAFLTTGFVFTGSTDSSFFKPASIRIWSLVNLSRFAVYLLIDFPALRLLRISY